MRLIQSLSLFAFAVTTFAQFRGEGVYTISPRQFSNKAITASPADSSVLLMSKSSTEPDQSQQWNITIARQLGENQYIYNIVNVKKSENGYLRLSRSNERLLTSTTTKYGGADLFKLQQGIDRLDTIFTAYDYVYLFSYDENILGGQSTINGVPSNDSVKPILLQIKWSEISSFAPFPQSQDAFPPLDSHLTLSLADAAHATVQHVVSRMTLAHACLTNTNGFERERFDMSLKAHGLSLAGNQLRITDNGDKTKIYFRGNDINGYDLIVQTCSNGACNELGSLVGYKDQLLIAENELPDGANIGQVRYFLKPFNGGLTVEDENGRYFETGGIYLSIGRGKRATICFEYE
ncbi:hypothetical protein BJ944DRAFT_250858 [Cunninghamella echinulata]|nr:hypothetical protein BJ944DRAFT_250858 [Cunninghamella echinulata]